LWLGVRGIRGKSWLTGGKAKQTRAKNSYAYVKIKFLIVSSKKGEGAGKWKKMLGKLGLKEETRETEGRKLVGNRKTPFWRLEECYDDFLLHFFGLDTNKDVVFAVIVAIVIERAKMAENFA